MGDDDLAVEVRDPFAEDYHRSDPILVFLREEEMNRSLTPLLILPPGNVGQPPQRTQADGADDQDARDVLEGIWI